MDTVVDTMVDTVVILWGVLGASTGHTLRAFPPEG